MQKNNHKNLVINLMLKNFKSVKVLLNNIGVVFHCPMQSNSKLLSPNLSNSTSAKKTYINLKYKHRN